MNRLHLRLIAACTLVFLLVGGLVAGLVRPVAVQAVGYSLKRSGRQAADELARHWNDPEGLQPAVDRLARKNDVVLTVWDASGAMVATGDPSVHAPDAAHQPMASPADGPLPPPGPPQHPRVFHVEEPVHWRGETIGYVTLDPVSPERLVERGFHVLIGPVGILGLLLTSLILWPVAWGLTRRLRSLETVSSRIAQGDYSARAEVHGNDEIDRLAHRFNAMTAILEEQREGRRRFFQAISHELRSPLTRLNVVVSLLGETPSAEEIARCLVHLTRDVQEIKVLVDSLLEVARGAEALPPLAKVPVDLVELSRTLAEPLGITLQTSGGAAIVPADPVIAGRAIRNILENAARYGGADKTVELSVTREADQVRLRFRDHGSGLPPDQCERIFEPFYRPDEARSRAMGGVGLGLALVRLAMEQHGGTARAANAPDGGAIFELTFPDARARE